MDQTNSLIVFWVALEIMLPTICLHAPPLTADVLHMLTQADPQDCFAAADAGASVPIHLIGDRTPIGDIAGLTGEQRRWLEAQRFNGAAKRHVLIPEADGSIAAVVLGSGNGTGDPCGPAGLLVGGLAGVLPPGTYHLAGQRSDLALAAMAWGLGSYRFRRYKTNGKTSEPGPRLRLDEALRETTLAAVEAVWFGRDLINTPAEDMSPEDLEGAARALAKRHGAEIRSIVGQNLLSENFPMIHAVGRASSRPPRLIDLTWDATTPPR